jgi:hypothetical protein
VFCELEGLTSSGQVRKPPEQTESPAGAGGVIDPMGSQKCGIVGKSQPIVVMINPMISTRIRTWGSCG